MDRWTKFVMELENYRDSGNVETYFKISRQEYIQRLLNICYQHTKIFKIGDNVKQLLTLTNNNLREDYFLPFDSMFIDCNFEIGNQYVEGFLIQKGRTWIINEQKLRMDYDIIGFLNENGKKRHVFFDVPINKIMDGDKLAPMDEQMHLIDFEKPAFKNIQIFAINLLDFLNNPDVKLVEVRRTEEQNFKRIKKGKFPIPPTNFIHVTGELKEYINCLNSNGRFHYSYKFWVRGHFRTLMNETRYKDKVGARIWILPYIKGKGMLINKKYEVEKSSNQTQFPLRTQTYED